MGGGQPLLALLADAGEQDLARITVGVGDGQGFRRRSLRMRLGWNWSGAGTDSSKGIVLRSIGN
jgi:hypothetical protein